MNKSELLALLASKYDTVLGTTLKSTVASVSYYVSNVFDVVGDVGRTVNVMFFVKDEGGGGEVAYWGGSEPKPTPSSPTWGDTCHAWLQSKVADDTILTFSNLTTDNATERATVIVVIDVAGTWTEKRYAVWQNVQDEWRFEGLV